MHRYIRLRSDGGRDKEYLAVDGSSITNKGIQYKLRSVRENIRTSSNLQTKIFESSTLRSKPCCLWKYTQHSNYEAIPVH